jgi:hypothetical protein
VTLLGGDLLSQLKAQILLPPGSYFCCPLLQEQIHSIVWTDEMSIWQARMALPVQIKLKNPSQFPHQNNIPSSLRDMRPYAYHKFLQTTRATN